MVSSLFGQALIDYIKSDFDISVYWDTLNKNGITKERLLSYDRAIHSEPNLRSEQKEGLLRDLGSYMRSLKVCDTVIRFKKKKLYGSLIFRFLCLMILLEKKHPISYVIISKEFSRG